MNASELRDYIKTHPSLVKERIFTIYPGLRILKYSKKVFFENKWNYFLEECRGTIVDEEFTVVARPFTKIYNYGIEQNAPVIAPDEVVTAFRKVNGFMVSVTWYNNDILVSTTGSLTGDHIDMARELIDIEKFRETCSNNPNITFMFECVHPADPHIITEQTGMYLLGYRNNSWDSVVEYNPEHLSEYGHKFGCFITEVYRLSLDELLQCAKSVVHEGFVFYTADGRSSKIKSPFYLVSKWLARKFDVSKVLTDRKNIDEEFYGLLDEIGKDVTQFNSMNEQKRLAWIREFYSNALA